MELSVEYLFLTFRVFVQFLAWCVCVSFFLGVLYCPCHSFHTSDELLCLQMSAPCRLPEGDELDAGDDKRYFSPLLLMDADPVQMRMASYGVSYCKVQLTFLISRTVFSLGILDCNNICGAWIFQGILGPFYQFQAMRHLVESMSRHLFPNFKSDSDTVKWLMLRSDWDRLSPSTVAVMIAGEPAGKPLKAFTSVKHTWKVKPRHSVGPAQEVASPGKKTQARDSTSDITLITVN